MTFGAVPTLAQDHNSAEDSGPIIGIDLGTTYSCVAAYRNGKVEIIPNDQGNRITPSYVAFTEGERLVGDAAKNQATTNSERTIFEVKRLIGREFSDKTVQADKKLMPFKITSDRNNKPVIQIEQDGQKTRMYCTVLDSLLQLFLFSLTHHLVSYFYGRDFNTRRDLCNGFTKDEKDCRRLSGP